MAGATTPDPEGEGAVVPATAPGGPPPGAADPSRVLTVEDYPMIRAYPPGGKSGRGASQYWQVVWTENDTRRSTRAGKTEADATAKVEAIVARLDAEAYKSHLSVENLMTAWLDPERPRRAAWSLKYTDGCEYVSRRFIATAIGAVRCADLRREDVQRAVAAAPTAGEGARVKRVLSAAVHWGYLHGYLTLAPAKILGDVYWGAGGKEVREQGVDILAVPAASIPTAEGVSALAAGMEQLAASRREDVLAVWLAAYSGLRLGELLALRACDVNTTKRVITVRRQVVEVRGVSHVTAPKGRKVRTTFYPTIAPGGFALAEAVRRRVKVVNEVDPEGLLFETKHGNAWAQTRWGARRFRPAAKLANWPTRPVVDPRTEIERTKLVWTWHSLRHRFASWALWELEEVRPPDVAAAMGHADVSITLRVYSGGTADAMERLTAATGG